MICTYIIILGGTGKKNNILSTVSILPQSVTGKKCGVAVIVSCSYAIMLYALVLASKLILAIIHYMYLKS